MFLQSKQTFFLSRLVFRWANFRIETMNSVLQFASALFIVGSKGLVSPAFAGVCLNQIIGYAVVTCNSKKYCHDKSSPHVVHE
jgi:hypothetical protein